MKKIVLLFTFLWVCGATAWAQIPNGSIAPNFTVVDVQGQSHTLYTLLDQGKTVYLDVFATWCVPCWNYHNSHALEDLWDMYGPPGTNQAYVIAIEGDASTSVPCIFGSPSCVGGTVGDWTAGTPYPIADAAAVAGQYQITYFPTIFMICPADRKVYEVGQLPASGLWDSRNALCPPLALTTLVNSVQDVACYGGSNGSIDISVSGGAGPYTYNWSNGAHTQDLINVPAGTYTCSITNAAGWPGNTGPITVGGPSSALAVAVTGTTPVGCNGITGSITVDGVGGWPGNYSYHWSNGQNAQTATGLLAGNYTVTVTDDHNCTKTQVVNLPPASLPAISIAQPGTISCAVPSLQLNANVSGGSGNFSYQWFASNGGNIVSGGGTATPTVNAAGTYAVQVSDALTTCVSFSSTAVSGNTTQPTANAGPAMGVTCSAPSVTLAGTGSTGATISYAWTASNGGSIASGGNTLTPTVSAAGTYTLVVTNTANGCTATSSTAVTGNNTPPSASVTGGAVTCSVSSVTLGATTNAGTPSFAWTGPNGFTSAAQNPTVAETGNYTLTVLDANTGCTNTASATVASNTAAPGATATGGTLTCATTSLNLNGASSTNGATFAWTGPNNFTSNVANPSVAEVGEYALVVTNPANGCTSTAQTTVAQNVAAPVASAVTPSNLNCQIAQLQLDGSGSSQGANFTYAWTTSNGNIVSGAETSNPMVNQPGSYALVVTNTDNGCTATAATSVAQSPAVSAGIGGSTNVSCNGGANGAATVIPGGGNSTYTYAWSNGGTTASISGLAAGTYDVVVTDGENCTATTSVMITQPSILVTNASATAQTANGVNDGTATAAPAGGTSDYTYAWSNGQTTQSISGLAPGEYTVVVTDANGCTSAQTVTVNSYNCAISGNLATSNVSCFGAGNGTASVSLLGANEPVTFSWSNGGTTPTVENLAPGAYTVDVIDVTNCVLTFNVAIAEPTQLVANASATPETALGANDGTATAAPAGGTSDYTYAWSNGQTTPTITGLTPGEYSVVVTDAHGCTSTQTVNVLAYNCIIGSETTVANVSCYGLNNGSITLNLTGGTAPFVYTWSNGGNSASLTNLAPGTYSGTATDANGCEILTSATITEPEQLLSTSNSVNPVCANDNSGSIAVIAAGGVTPYGYAWSNGANTSSLSALNPGTYTVTLTDANGCSDVTTYQLVATDVSAPVITAQNTSIALGTSGAVTVTLQALGASVTDNCTMPDVTISPNSFECTQLGLHQVTITATDGAGNQSSVSIMVDVIDDIAPVVTCPQNITRCWYDNTVSYDAPVAVDNCIEGNGGTWNLVKGLPSGSVFPVGETFQTYTYTDASGNAGTCSFSVTVSTPISMAVASVTNDLNNQGIGAIDINISGGAQPYTFVWTSNGQVVGNTEDLSGLHAGAYTLEVKDANGCVIAVEGIVVSNTTSVIDPSWLTGVMLRPNPTNGITRISFATVPTSAMEISLIDATGRVVMSQISEQEVNIKLDCTQLPEGMYVVRFRTGNEVGVRKLIVGR